MRLFITNQVISDFNESSIKRGLFGAWVATNNFYKNLIRFGKFDEFHFFVLPENNKKYPSYKVLISYANNEKVKIKKLTELPSFLKKGKDLVFFTSSPAIFNVSYLRSIYAKKYFPICGLTHTISYAELLKQVFFQNMISDLQPFDSIVCTSRLALESVRRIHRVIRRNIFKEISITLSFKARLKYLPLGVNTEDYIKNNKNESRKKLGLPTQKVIILYFGRLSILDKADLYPLLLAFKSLLNENKNILLVLAGKNFQGNYGQKLKRMAIDMGIYNHVRFFFSPPQKDKYLLYVASDIFISPSDNLQESFGLTIIEAMASALPVVVSDWNGYKDIVIHNKTGFLIPSYWTKCDQDISNSTYLFSGNLSAETLSLGQSVCIDIRKMIEYLSFLIKRKDLRLKFGFNARERVLKEYDWSVIIPKFEMLCNELMDKAKECKASPRRKPIFYPRYFECFKHYPSHILDKRTNITVTEEGIHLLKTRKFPSGIPSLDLIIPQIVLLILFYLKEKRILSIEKIGQYINGFFKEINRERINYHIMWMLKNYLVEVTSYEV